MNYEQRAIDLAKQLDQMNGSETTQAMDEQLEAVGELCGGLSVHGFGHDLRHWLDGQASDYVNEIVNYSNGNASPSLEENVYCERYVELAREWYEAASKIMAQTSEQVAA